MSKLGAQSKSRTLPRRSYLRGWSIALLASCGIWLSACASTPRRLTHATVESRQMGREMSFAVYTPKHFSPQERLPLVVYLHGAGDDPGALDGAGIAARLDESDLPRMVLVAPEGNWGFWENWASGKRPYRSWVMRELLPWIKQRYNTADCPEGCHLLGNSMGGYGALSFSLHEPGYFSTVTAISPPIHDTASMKQSAGRSIWRLFLPIDEIWGTADPSRVQRKSVFQAWKSPQALNGSRLLLAWGSEEDTALVNNNEQLHQHLVDHGIDHDVIRYVGGHDWESWSPVILEALRRNLDPGSTG